MTAFHIAISANQCWNIYNFRKGLLQRLLNAGIKVTIVAPEDECSVKLQRLGCDVIHLPVAAQGRNPITDIRLVIEYARILKQLKPNLVINYTIKPVIYGSLAAAIAGVPSLAITTGLGYTFINDNLVARVARSLYKFALRFPLQVWFLNRDDRDVFLKSGLVDPKRTFILDGEGIDTEYFAPVPKTPAPPAFKFLLIARMLWDKGVGEFVEAAQLVKERHPSVVFQLLGGSGAENPSAVRAEQIESWQKAGLIEYLGSVNDVRQAIADSDCVVLPSYREGVPRTLLEGAAMAKPLIATNVPGCREVVLNQQTGLLCRARDSADLAQKMLQMVEMSAADRNQMGLASRTYAKERFNENVIVRKYFEFLKTKCGFGGVRASAFSADSVDKMKTVDSSLS